MRIVSRFSLVYSMRSGVYEVGVLLQYAEELGGRAIRGAFGGHGVVRGWFFVVRGGGGLDCSSFGRMLFICRNLFIPFFYLSYECFLFFDYVFFFQFLLCKDCVDILYTTGC